MDWRDEVPSLADQLWYMYENKIGTDLQIAVTNDEKVQSFDCHRTIMRRLSFNFELQDDDENFMYVDVGDMDPDLFVYIIKFAYTDKIVFKSFKDSIQIHRVASNYQMNHLRKECENFMQNKVDKDSVWSLLSHINKGPDLTALTDYFLTGQTCACLESPEFLSCNQTTLELLLSQESINATELQLIQAVLKWTRHKNGNKPFDSETARRILGPCISLLRFLCLTAADFSTYVAQSGLISNEDALLVLINLSTKGQAKLPSYICTTDVPRKPCSATFKVNCDAAVEVRKEEEDEKREGAECLPAAPAVQSQKIRRSKKAKAEKIQKEAPSTNRSPISENEVFFTRLLHPEFAHLDLAQLYDSPTSFQVDLQLSRSALLAGFRLDTQVKNPDLVSTIDTYRENVQLSVYNTNVKKFICCQGYTGSANYGAGRTFVIRFKKLVALEAQVWYSVHVRFSNAGCYKYCLRPNRVIQNGMEVKFNTDENCPRSANPIAAVILCL